MKRFLLIIFLSCCIIGFSQEYDDNRFSNSETSTRSSMVAPDPQVENDPNPGDPVPINDYIPLLILVAVGGIVYYQSKKKILK